MNTRVLHRKTDAYNWTIDVVDDAGAVLAPHTRCVDGVITVFMFGEWHGPGCCQPITDAHVDSPAVPAAAPISARWRTHNTVSIAYPTVADAIVAIAQLDAMRAGHTENTDLRARVAELEAAAIELSEALRVARADAAAKAHRYRELGAIIDDINERIAGIIDPERPPYRIPAPSPRGPDPGNPNEAGEASNGENQ